MNAPIISRSVYGWSASRGWALWGSLGSFAMMNIRHMAQAIADYEKTAVRICPTDRSPLSPADCETFYPPPVLAVPHLTLARVFR